MPVITGDDLVCMVIVVCGTIVAIVAIFKGWKPEI